MRPIVKWAGGKTQLLDYLLPLIPQNINTYYEPFFGGGALYFAIRPERAIINDYNAQLMNLYDQVKNNLTNLKRQLTRLENQHIDTNEYYSRIRDRYNNCLKNNELSLRSASLMLYLNKSGFNGLYRLNIDGLYNVPSGHRNEIKLYDRKNINDVSALLQNAILRCDDFEEACRDAQEGDFVFFDSPYYNTFDTYQAGGFSEEDHIRLKALFDRLTDRGVFCLLTNSNEDFIKDLYEDYNITIVNVKRMINCDGKKRTGEEVIITNY